MLYRGGCRLNDVGYEADCFKVKDRNKMKLVQRGKIKTNSNRQMDGDRDKRREGEKGGKETGK